MIAFELTLRRGPFTLDVAFRSDARVSGLYGPSGSGKTTVLLALAGLVRPESGHVSVDGACLYDSGRGAFVPPERRAMGVVFQDGRLFPHLTVRGNLVASRPRPDARGVAFDEVVDLLDLEPLLARSPREISGGEARRVAIGRALLARPRMLLLDEPLAGLDPALARRVLAYLIRLRRTLELRMLYVSHAWSDFLALVDEMAFIESGRLRAHGSPHALLGAVVGEGEGVETTLLGRAVDDAGAVDVDGVRLETPGSQAAPGDDVFVTIAAEDVLLAMGDVPPTSARNRLTGRVAAVRAAADRVFVEIDAGIRFWAEVTPASRESLGLVEGAAVTALVKARALRATALPRRSAVR